MQPVKPLDRGAGGYKNLHLLENGRLRNKPQDRSRWNQARTPLPLGYEEQIGDRGLWDFGILKICHDDYKE